MDRPMEWTVKLFRNLDADDLYDLLKLRVDVFVVEQNCAYPEIDEKDRHPETRHLIGKNTGGKVVAYSRLLPPGLSFEQASLGRVVVARDSRGQGISRAMLEIALEQMAVIWPGRTVRIGAQVYLREFYETLGFKAVSTAYLEDGIAHVNMDRG